MVVRKLRACACARVRLYVIENFTWASHVDDVRVEARVFERVERQQRENALRLARNPLKTLTSHERPFTSRAKRTIVEISQRFGSHEMTQKRSTSTKAAVNVTNAT